jgi:hypothetical protein
MNGETKKDMFFKGLTTPSQLKAKIEAQKDHA